MILKSAAIYDSLPGRIFFDCRHDRDPIRRSLRGTVECV
jgi:hypothetical protein